MPLRNITLQHKMASFLDCRGFLEGEVKKVTLAENRLFSCNMVSWQTLPTGSWTQQLRVWVTYLQTVGLTYGLGTSGEMTTQGVTWSTSPVNQYFGIGGQSEILVAWLIFRFHILFSCNFEEILSFLFNTNDNFSSSVRRQLHGSELKQATLLSHGRQQKGAVFFCHLSAHYHIYIVKHDFTSRDD